MKIFLGQAVGRAYLDYLLEEQEYDEAGRLCVKILGKKKESWEEEIYKFAKIHQLKVRKKKIYEYLFCIFSRYICCFYCLRD